MGNQDFFAWCQAATAKIRYKPDRESVSRELRDHLDDRYDALIAKGYSPEEATARTLKAMGSPQEIAPQLAAIHRPLLGYLYSITRFLGIATGICAAILVVFCLGDNFFYHFSTDRYKSYGAYGEDFYEPNLSAYVEGYLLRIPEAALDREAGELYIQLQATNWPGMELFDGFNYFWAVDSLGNCYPSIVEREYGTNYGLNFRGGTGSSTGFRSWNCSIDGFDCDADWVELRYDRDGRDIVFRIELTGGGEE